MRRRVHDGGFEMDDRTAEVADLVEEAIADVMGDAPLVRLVADHVARRVAFWVDLQLQTRVTEELPAVSVISTGQPDGVSDSSILT